MIPAESYPRVDFHVHAFPDDLAERALAQLEAQTGLPTLYDGTLTGLQQWMIHCQVDLAVIQPVATKPTQVHAINQWCLRIAKTDRIIAFGSLHPDLSAMEVEHEISLLQQGGLRGVKLHPEYQAFYPDEDGLEPLYTAVQRAGMILVMHSGMDAGFTPPVKATPQRVRQVVDGFPKLKLVAAHLGGYRLWDDVEKYLLGQRIWFDTAYCQPEFPPERLREWIGAHGQERFLFASDTPWGDPGRHWSWLLSARLSEPALRAVAMKNACTLLNIGDILKADT